MGRVLKSTMWRVLSEIRSSLTASLIRGRMRITARPWVSTRIADLPSIEHRLGRRHQGLRKLSPDLISKARDETAAQVNRIGLTFLGTTVFCLLSLLSPDSALLGGSDKINVPLFAGPVSFVGFMVLGPAVLIALRVYLEIYVEHSVRLDQLAHSVSAVRAPTLVPLDNPLIRFVGGLIFYAMLPVTILLFAWKASVFPGWGSQLFGLAVGVIVMMLFRKLKTDVYSSLSASFIVATIAASIMTTYFGSYRVFNLRDVNLSDRWLKGEHLLNANLNGANLSRANLSSANLGGAHLTRANLSGANLTDAILYGTGLYEANLTDANLTGAYLWGSHLNGANLTRTNLTRARLAGAGLSGADLSHADLSGALLYGADLTHANLSHADLRGASLGGADLGNADLSHADLSGANLTDVEYVPPNARADKLVTSSGDVKNLTQTQLDEACGANTKLPGSLTVRSCPLDWRARP